MTTFEYERPWLYPKQSEALFNDARYSIVEASTKSGKTVGCMAWLFELAALTGKEGRNYWWTAPTLPTAKIAYRRLKRGIPRHLYKANDSDVTLTLVNGSTLWFKGADRPDSLYGEDVYAAVIDEATRCKEEAWHAIRSTLTATRGPIRIIGNVKGRKNWAYKLARRAQSGARNMAYFKLTAYDAIQAGVLHSDEIADAKEALPEDVFKELYLAIPTDDGSNPFGMQAIQDCVDTGDRQAPLRLAIAGWPKTGKSTVAKDLQSLGYRVRATDGLITTHDWSAASASAATWFDGGAGVVIEGVAVGRALRKWLPAHGEGTPCDVLLWLDNPVVATTPKQDAMGKGCTKVWNEIRGDLEARGVQVVTSVDAFKSVVRLASTGSSAAPAEPVVWGWDFARAVDYTVGIALDREYRTVRRHSWQRPWGETKADVAKLTGATPAWGDSTGLGDVVVEDLQTMGCPIMGYTFTQKSRQLLMQRLQTKIHQRGVTYPPEVAAQLSEFEYEYSRAGVKYVAPPGLHDDEVMALALAVYGRDQIGVIVDAPKAVITADDQHPGVDWETGDRLPRGRDFAVQQTSRYIPNQQTQPIDEVEL